jgi:hypothetical protein
MKSYVEVSEKVWPKGATVIVCSVPWDAAYTNIVQFASMADRDAYLSGRASNRTIISQNTSIRPGRPITIGIPYNKLNSCNYLYLKTDVNPVSGDLSKTYCYFIESMDYASPTSTIVTLQLDVWTTRQFDTQFGYSYVERGHIGIANANAGTSPSAMRRYFDIPEGLDTGNQMATVSQSFNNFGSDGWTSLLSITNDLSKPAGTEDAPSSETASGSVVDGLISAANVYAVDNGLDLMKLIAGLGKKGWIGRNTQSVFTMPKKFVQKGSALTIHEDYSFTGVSAYSVNGKDLDIDAGDMVSALQSALPERYSELLKLCSYPYSVISASNQAGAVTLYKPQFLASGRLTFHAAVVLLAPFSRVALYLKGYNAQGSSDLSSSYADPTGLSGNTMTVDAGDWIDGAIVFDDWPQFSILNDSYSIYLASNAHSRAYSYESAGWSRDKSQSSADLSYETSNRRIDTARNQRNINQAAGAVNSLLGAAGSGDMKSAGIGLAQSAVSGAANYASSELGFKQQEWENDANYKLQNKVIKGDYENTVHGINATVQDAALTPPSVAGASGGMGFNLSNGFIGLRVCAKMLSTGAMAAVGEYWLRYGYAIRRYMKVPANLVCMTHFAYWKLQDTYIRLNEGTETDRQTIRAIFSKGVTVWSDPDDIGMVDPGQNRKLSGYAY